MSADPWNSSEVIVSSGGWPASVHAAAIAASRASVSMVMRATTTSTLLPRGVAPDVSRAAEP